MKAKVINVNGGDVKEIELEDFVFNIEPNESVIYEAIKNELANKRQGTASTKTKAEVSGSGTKPWKQKGTGRARVGTKRNPVWYHGGVAFGPKPRDYSYSIPKKIKNLAYRSILSKKVKDNQVIIVDKISLDSYKTKELNSMLKQIVNESKVNLILGDSEADKIIKKSGNNISWLNCLSYKRLNVHDIFYSKKTIITEEAVVNLDKMLSKKRVEG